jgi:hypothetical protein
MVAGYDEAAWQGLVNSFERGVAERRDGGKVSEDTSETRGLDLAIQCLMDSYRAILGLW